MGNITSKLKSAGKVLHEGEAKDKLQIKLSGGSTCQNLLDVYVATNAIYSIYICALYKHVSEMFAILSSPSLDIIK